MRLIREPDDEQLGNRVDADEGVGYWENEENESDLNLSNVRLSDAVVTATDWTTETLLNQLKRQNILLNPRFQRRDAWTRERKSKFIESLFLGLPVPQIVLAEQKKERGKYLVIDGKQRLLTIRQFGANAEGDEFHPLRLTRLEILQHLNGLTYEDMLSRPELSSEVSAFQNQTIRTVVIKNWPDEEFLFLVFLRLNTGSVRLSPQELRQALHPGPFLDFADEYSIDSKLLHRILGNDGPDFRMRDVELVIRYYAFRNFIGEYRGNLKSFLDRTCKKLNDRWKADEAKIREQAKALEYAIETTIEVFGERNAFRKWNGETFERQFNRAVFDIMVFYFSDQRIGGVARYVKHDLVEAFKRLCETDRKFRSSLEATTKSLDATFTRLQRWSEALRSVTGVDVPRIQLVKGRICVSNG